MDNSKKGITMNSIMTIEDGVEIWKNEHGKPHRLNGPAIKFPNGNEEWWVNGKMHREVGPAFTSKAGLKFWYRNGKLHRENGPAVETPEKKVVYYLNGEKTSPF